MALKSARVVELEEAIAQATATLDVSDASRIGLQEAFDSARETLSDAYGTGFEAAVAEFIQPDDEDDEATDEDENSDEDDQDDDEGE